MIQKTLSLLSLVVLSFWSSAQTANYQYTKAQHQKEVIGYFTQWDAWKGANHGVPKGFYNQLNIDYSQYTMLNWSFFGVAVDGSMHSADLRDKQIHQAGVNQQPGPILWDDIYSSWDYWLLFGELEIIQYLPTDLDQQPTNSLYWVYQEHGYKGDPNGSGWLKPSTGETGAYPLPLPKPGGAKGVMELAHDNGVKLMASIGGWSMSKHFADVAADPAKRATFVADCKKLIDMGFDGIDIDWEFPGPFSGMNFTGSQADYANFTTLMAEIRTAIGPNKLITAAFNASPTKLAGFDWAALNNTMDYFNMMSYDMHGGWSNKAGHNSPLYPYPNEEAGNASWNDTYTYLVSQGVNPAKITMGVAFYGRGVKTASAAQLNGATVKVPKTIQPDGPVITAADYTNWGAFDGTPTYFAIQQDINNWTYHWDNNAKVPYLTKGNYFVSYDNEQSIEEKAKYVNQNNIGGVIIWHAFGDLFPGTVTQTYANKLPHAPSTTAPLANVLNRVFALGDTSTTTPPPTPSALRVTVNAPIANQQFYQQNFSNIALDVTIQDSTSAIANTSFLLNGNAVNFTNTGAAYTYNYLPTAYGNNTLAVQAVNADGDTASATVSFSVAQIATNSISQLVSANDWDTLFPFRFGTPGHLTNTTGDFYSYTNFITAVSNMANITVTFERRCATNLYKITRTDKTTGVSTVIRKDAGFDGNSGAVITEVVDYANFANVGTNEEKTRDLLAFLANISQETTGGWPTAPKGRYAWGLYYNEEVGYAGTNNIGYVDAGNTLFPAVAGKSYHGRGPIQLSWNYNYGQVSQFLYGDKNVLLANPDLVTSDGALAFQTAIWFWMTPQYPKPSCHDVMAGNWTPTSAQAATGLIAGFGATVNIINGGIECNSGTEIAKVQHRIGHFERYTQYKNIGMALDGTNSPIELGCANMPQFQIDYQECNNTAGIAFANPVSGSSVAIALGDSIPVSLTITDPNNELSNIFMVIDGNTIASTATNWYPTTFGTYTLVAKAVKGADTLTATSTVTVIDASTATGCEGVSQWDANTVYAAANQEVVYQGKLYKNKWWTHNNAPGTDPVWEYVKDCGTIGTPNTAPVISNIAPANNAQFNVDSLSNFAISFTVTDAENNLQSVTAAVNGVAIALATTGSNYSSSYAPTATGSYTLLITATDSLNETSTSSTTFDVNDNVQTSTPEISNVVPANGADFIQVAFAPISISATVTDSVNAVSAVTIEVNGQVLSSTANGSIYSASFTPNAHGSQTVKVEATNSIGVTAVYNSTFTVTDTTTNTTNCGKPTWSAQVYATPNTEVYYAGKIYKNQWYAAANEIPGVDQVWSYVSDCGTQPPLTSSCGYPVWNSTAVYANAGQKVFYNGKIYQSKWWTQGSTPDLLAEWDYVQDCNANAQPSVYPNPVQTILNVVVHKAATNFAIADLNIGQVLLQSTTPAINVTSLTSGNYVVNISYADGTTDSVLFTKQ